jgi:hypothetical protein
MSNFNRFGFLIAAGLFTAATPALADVNAANPASVQRVLQEAGYRAELTTDSGGDPMIESDAGGSRFIVLFYDCEDNRNCESVQFFAGYSDAGASYKAINEFNQARRYARAYITDDGDARLEMDVETAPAGIPDATFSTYISLFGLLMTRFEEQIGWE